MTEPIRITLVVCTYNRAQVLDRSLAILRRQTTSSTTGWDVLVVDNNCTDDTQAVIQRHCRAGLPVSTVHEPEQGLTAARRRGVEAATAPWIAFVDDDCLLDDDWVEEAARFARAHPDCGAFGGQVILEWEVEPPAYVTRFPWAYAWQDHGPEPKLVRLLVGAGMVVRKAVLEECGWTTSQFLPDRIGDRLVSGGDVELALRVGSRSQLWYTPRCKLRHLIPAERATLSYLRRICFGLGTCKFFEDSMLWPGTYRRWLRSSLLQEVLIARRAARDLLLTLRGQRSVADFLIRLSFLGGYAAGAWRLARKDSASRRALLGCASRAVA